MMIWRGRWKQCTLHHLCVSFSSSPSLFLPSALLFFHFHLHSDETAMTANQAQGIIEYMPTHAERKSLRDHMKNSKDGEEAAKSFERLCECEKFMVAMMTVKQSKRKIRALLFKLQFRGCIHDLARGEY